LAGHIVPPICCEHLPKALLERFCRGAPDIETALVNCLQTLALGP
jgi:hypothetical protein